MSNKDKAPLVPKLRFPEFQGDGEWRVCKAGDFLSESRNPSEQNDPARRITVRLNLHGVEHREHRGTESTEATNHFQRSAGQFIYGKQNIHKGAFGIIPTQLHNFETSQDLPCFDFKEICNPKWVFYHFAREDVYQPLELKMTGTGSKRLSEKNFLGLAIPAPSSSEQNKVADCLSSLDELIAAQARKVDALKTHKKGLMQQLFPREGETQPRLRFPEFRDAGEWEEGSISDLATTVMGNAFRSTDFVESGTQVVRIGNLYQGELQLERAPVHLSDTQAEENSKFGVHPLDLLMSMTGTVGKRDYGFVIQVPPDCKPLLLNQRVMKLAPTVKCDPGFLLQLLKSDRLLDAIYSVPGGTKQANLSAQHIKDLSISYPPKSVQQHIALCLSRLDALITLETQELDTLKTHKKGLMQQLFPSEQEVAA